MALAQEAWLYLRSHKSGREFWTKKKLWRSEKRSEMFHQSELQSLPILVWYVLTSRARVFLQFTTSKETIVKRWFTWFSLKFCWMKWYLESFLVHTVLLSWKNLSLLNGSFLAILPWNIAPQNCNHTIHCQCATKQWNCKICRKISVFTTFKGC